MSSNELFLRFPGGRTRAVTLSFDDGKIFDRQMAQILNQYGMKCTFNLNGGRIAGDEGRVQFDEFDEVYRGHEIAAHTFTHPHLDTLDLGGIAYQIIKDREVLENAAKHPVEGFAYPFGLKETDGMVDCIRSCGIRYGRTTVPTHNFHLPTDFLRWNPTCHQADPAFSELVERFFAPDDEQHPWRIRPLLFFVWGHSYEFQDKWEDLDDICKKLGGRENVWYATNMEIADYVSAFKSLRRSADSKYILNPTNIDIYVRVDGVDRVLKKGELSIVE